MSPRQLLRLRETRKSDTFDDQKTPAQIATAEVISLTEQDLQDYLLSQVRQILGTDNWYDAVPARLFDLAPLWRIRVNCQASNVVGDFVRVYGPRVSSLYRVDKADITTSAKMPAWAVLVAKESPTVGTVQVGGILEDYWTDLTPGKVHFLSADGTPKPVPPSGAGVFVQRIGVALDTNALKLQPEMFMVRLS